MKSSNEQNPDGGSVAKIELPFIDEKDGFGFLYINTSDNDGKSKETELLNNLATLRKTNYPKKIHMTVFQPRSCNITKKIVESLEETFNHYSSLQQEGKGGKWKITFHLFTRPCPNIAKVLEAAFTSELFGEFVLGISEWISKEVAAAIRDGLNKTSSLKSLCIIDLSGNESAPFIDEVHALLIEGLKENKSLKEFYYFSERLPDAIFARMVKALMGHPTLGMLQLGSGRFGKLTMTALQNLLKDDSSNISSLVCVRGQNDGIDELEQGSEINALIEGLQANNSLYCLGLYGWQFPDLDMLFEGVSKGNCLQELEIANCGISIDFSKILELLSKCPKLLRVDLSRNKISKMGSCKVSNLERKWSMNEAPKTKDSELRRLILDQNPLTENNWREIEDWEPLGNMLQVIPHLFHLGLWVDHKVLPSKIAHLLDMNKCRTFFNVLRDDKFPLSLWPLVLEKVKHKFQDTKNLAQQTNVFYHLIKDGGFLHQK